MEDKKLTEQELELESLRNRVENQNQREDAQRRMAWYSLAGMLFYPLAVVFAILFNLEQAAEILGDMASTYFVSVAAIVAAFYGKEAYLDRKSPRSDRMD